MSNNGILYPTVQAMPAGTPRDSAIANQNNAANSQADLIRAVGGKRRRHRKYKRGGAGGANVAVPQFQMSYTPSGGPGQAPNDIIKDNASVSSQSAANAEYDKYAAIKGGSQKRKWGGMNRDWVWGCYSGGRRTIKKRTKRRNKSRSKKRTHRRR